MSDHEHPVDPDRVARAAARAIGPDDARAVGELLDVVGDPFRMRILSALHAAGELCVGDIALALDLSEDAVGYGLRVLRGGGLVRRDPPGGWRSMPWPTACVRVSCSTRSRSCEA